MDTRIIHVVDDDDSMRTAIVRLLEIAGYKVLGYRSAEQFFLAVSSDCCGCLILDICLPGLSGLDLQELLLKKKLSLPIVFLTGHGDIPQSVRAMKAGAVDFLTKPVVREDLIKAVERALEHDLKQRQQLATIKSLTHQYQSLTPREKLVLSHVVQGSMNKEIAQRLDVSERTIKTCRANILEKFSAQSVVDLVRIVDCLDKINESA
jgi:FixJ family two-component response regulator